MTSQHPSHTIDYYCSMAGTCSLVQQENNLSNSEINVLEPVSGTPINWRVLPLWALVAAGVTGNALVCASIVVERKLQNVTNYFLVSLAVADLLVSMFVMPCCIVQEMMGYWPFGLVMCDVWLLCDVVMCTSSIMHMCTISMDRYTAIRDPLRSRAGSKSAITVGLKVAAVWLVSIVIGSPLIGLGALNPTQILSDDRQCAIFNSNYVIYGSLAAFFGPLTIMLAAFSLTIRLLNKQSRQMPDDGGIRRCTSERNSTKSANGGSFRAQASPGNIHRQPSPDNTCTSPRSRGSNQPKQTCMEYEYRANNSPAHSNKSIDSRPDSKPISITKNRISTRNGKCDQNRSQTPDIRFAETRAVTSRPDAVKPHDVVVVCKINRQPDESTAVKQELIDDCSGCSSRKTEIKSGIHRGKSSKLTNIEAAEEFKTTNHPDDVDENKKPTVATDGITGEATKDSTKAGLIEFQIESITLPNRFDAPARVTMATSRSLDIAKRLIGDGTCDGIDKHTTFGCVEHRALFRRADRGGRIPVTNAINIKRARSRCISKSTSFPISMDWQPSDCDENSPLLASDEAPNDVIECCATLPNPGSFENASRSLNHVTINRQCDVTDNRTISSERRSAGIGDVRSTSRQRWSCHVIANGLPPERDVMKCTKSTTTFALSNFGGDICRSFQNSTDNRHPQPTRPSTIATAQSLQATDNGVTETSMTSSGRAADECDVTSYEKSSPVMFKSLVKKHAVAFKVAGMLVSTREDRQTKVFNSVKTERKAVKVLGIMFGIFCTCWTPFFTANLAMGMCQTCDIHHILFKVFLWFGYVSSTLNPIVYTIFNRDFKNTFVRLLRCHCSAADIGADGRVSQLQMLVRQNPHLVNGGAMLAIRALRPRGVATGSTNNTA